MSFRSRVTCITIHPDGKLRVYRSRTGGNDWEALTEGLPQEDCYVNVLRDAMSVDSLESCRNLFRDDGWTGLRLCRFRRYLDVDRAGPAGGNVGRGADPAMIRVVLPGHLRNLAQTEREIELDVTGPVTQASILDALEAAYPVLTGTIRDQRTEETATTRSLFRL